MSLLPTRHRVVPFRPDDDPEENDDTTRPIRLTPEIGLAAAVIQFALLDLKKPTALDRLWQSEAEVAREAYRFLSDPDLEQTLWWQWLAPHYSIARIRAAAEELWQRSPYRTAAP